MNGAPVRHRVLVIEDEKDMAFVLARNLEAEGFEVRAVHDGATGISTGLEDWAHVVVLDLMLPKQNGLTVLRTLRGAGIEVPVLLLTARRGEVEKLQGFRLGADDYVTKPFNVAELMARVAALVRRSVRGAWAPTSASAATFRAGTLEVDFTSRTVRQDGALVSLAPKAFDLLAALLRREGAVARRSDLLREVWGYAEGVNSRTLDAHVRELRRKFGAEAGGPLDVKTVWRVGYQLTLARDGV